MTRESSPKVAFITARLDEDEQTALAVPINPSNPEKWTPSQYKDSARGWRVDGIANVVDGAFGPDAHHIARQDPARTLRKVAGLRKLLDAHLGYYGAMDDEHLPVPTLTILAAIWDDHEDYPALVGTVTS